jgi:hypothetical protein
MQFFKIDTCELKGCLNNHKGTCSLDKMTVEVFAVPLAYFQDASVCQVRQQINVYRTENLIENKQ